MIESENAVYFNAKGEMVDRQDILQQEGCNLELEYCASAIVPDGFTFRFENFDSFKACSDISDLVCVLKLEELEGTVTDPSGRVIPCPLLVDAVHLIGNAKFHINVGELIPDFPGTRFGPPCRLTMDAVPAVNQVISYTCPQESCVERCFDTVGSFAIAPRITTDNCGRQVVTVRGGLFLRFLGCEE
ncbi:hypothetical protein M3936_13250 [Sutcliffiella horikoshii]|uniref:hypothetical protein n=1 Tax=Sutcliffiella horikoshii TaxID=79883 RepID=UPI00203AF5E0|nr:hypothetical protein [Sutcliffiella horikoshii]MCM3618550.1 hypothetical protein [Sutcliffiella horikoshii]